MKKQIVYKVCRRNGDGTYNSALMYRQYPELNHVYALNEVTKPRIGRLFAFDTQKAAQEYLTEINFVLFKCEAHVAKNQLIPKEDTTPTSYFTVPFPGEMEVVTEFWRRLVNLRSPQKAQEYVTRTFRNSTWVAWQGTVLCTYIKPIELLQKED